MSNIPKMGQLPTPEQTSTTMLSAPAMCCFSSSCPAGDQRWPDGPEMTWRATSINSCLEMTRGFIFFNMLPRMMILFDWCVLVALKPRTSRNGKYDLPNLQTLQVVMYSAYMAHQSITEIPHSYDMHFRNYVCVCLCARAQYLLTGNSISYIHIVPNPVFG